MLLLARERLSPQQVYLGERAEAAAAGFFREGNLTELRDLALRFTAERVDRDLEDTLMLRSRHGYNPSPESAL